MKITAELETWRHTLKSWQFSRTEQLAFLEDLTALVVDGVSVNQAVAAIATIQQGVMHEVAVFIVETIACGRSLADGLKPWFPAFVVELIRAGENAGTLKVALQAALSSLAEQQNQWLVLVTALAYPLLVVVLALTMIVFVKRSVLESFALIRPVSFWPPVGHDLYFMAIWIENAWPVVLATVVFFGLSLFYALPAWVGKSRCLFDSLPLFSDYRALLAARVMYTLGLLTTHGVVIKKALQIMQLQAQPYLAWHLLQMEHRLSGGEDNIAAVLETELIFPADLLRLQVVATGRGFEKALLSLGLQARRRAQQRTTKMGKLTGGLLLILAAGLAIFIVYGIYSVGSSVAG